MNWVALTGKEQWANLLRLSHEHPIAVFKHSTRCSVSLTVKRQLEHDWSGYEEAIYPVYLDLLNYRSVSDDIAASSGIKHESPQLILFLKGVPVYAASHASIDFSDFLARLKKESHL
ncbi:MAG: bacillithiol system redox-active protein YtxJ [Chitinophagales bacterium]